MFVSFCTMDVSRCVLITVEEQIWKSTVPYLSKRCLEYNWIVNRPKDSEKSEVEVFVWWCGKAVFSATALRSHLKRLKQKNPKECFKISKAVKTESILRKLVHSAKTHHWGDGFIGKELMEYLKTGILRLKKKSKVTEKMDTETAEQENGPPPPPPPPPPSPVPAPPLPQQSDPQQSEIPENPDNKQQVKLSQNQVNGLVLRLLSRAASGVTNLTEDVNRVSGKLDKLAEQLYHKLYDPMFDGDCKCDKCK